ncbi:hypothetical protein F5Y01DRAFT_327670 [Xylaria sp. FL0043]|nr:hypothetical protein F5Y01DRAFT_327670 [Xylaria sp. FL0043]
MTGLEKSHLFICCLALVILSQWTSLIHAQGNPMSCCMGDDCDADDEGLELNEVQSAPTADLSPGIGPRRVLGGRKGDNWELTVDTTRDAANQLQPEYILNGQIVKTGQGMAGPAAAAIAADLLEWNPSPDSPGMTVEGLDECTWTIKASSLGPPASISWQRQITAPLPLEAVNEIIEMARKDYTVMPPISLLPAQYKRGKRLIYVSREFFQSFQGEIPKDPTPDLLGFFSLVISYVKAASDYRSGVSPKFLLPILPRNDFQTMFNLVRGSLGSSLDMGDGSLYNIVKTLACYEWYTDDDYVSLEVDTGYCTGDVENPAPGPKLDQLGFQVTGGKINPAPSFTIKEWMDDLQANKGDRLSIADKTYDGQIGGFGDKMEYVLGTTRLVPLFEFRDLGSSVASQFEDVVTTAENEVINLHTKYATAPAGPSSRKAKRRVKRQLSACPANMTSVPVSNTSSTASVGSSITSSFNSSIISSVTSSTVSPITSSITSLQSSMNSSASSSFTPTVTSFTTSVVESPTPTIIATSSVSCWLQNEDPDQGITSQYCVCDTSVTAPVLGATLAQSELCAYKC